MVITIRFLKKIKKKRKGINSAFRLEYVEVNFLAFSAAGNTGDCSGPQRKRGGEPADSEAISRSGRHFRRTDQEISIPDQ